uniref:DnaJ homolog subfamily B member 6 isoform X1 n=1 Tax=Elaeis guineensis var. tenera TaxID=51953 RepID=A0A6I9RJF3_ELAGV|nr:dnaJ homolog subfamily B member 6 isoform X1 [Elaeis guineensis]
MGTEQLSGRPGSHYAVLGVRPDASAGEIRSAFRKLALIWHPDRRGREPWLVEEANRRFQQIHEAYQVLSDQKRRTLYDAGLFDPVQDDEDEVEGFDEFVQEMLMLTAKVRREVSNWEDLGSNIR